jgi:hypothetical protein
LDGDFDLEDRAKYPLNNVVGNWGVSVERLSVLQSPGQTRPIKNFSLTLLLMVINDAADHSFKELDDNLAGKFFMDPLFVEKRQLVGDLGNYRPYLPWGLALENAYKLLLKGKENDLLKLAAFLASSCIVVEFDSMNYI